MALLLKHQTGAQFVARFRDTVSFAIGAATFQIDN
jgi:hypothetical protein